MKRPVKIALRVVGVILGLFLLLGIAALLILPSNWFREKVRSRIVYEIERASGGRVEIGAFKVDWSTLSTEIAPFVLHGTEPAGERPLLRAESVQVGLKIISAFKRDVDIASLVVDRPQINLLVDANGITNFPKPKLDRPKSDKNPLEQLLALAVQQITLRNGEIRYADQRLPLHLKGEYLNASLAYNFAASNYAGTLSLESLTVDAGPTLPMTVSFDSRVALFKNRLQVDSARMRMRDTQIEFTGTIEDFSKISMNFDVQANGSLQELGKPLRLPEPHIGNGQFKGKLTYNPGERLRVAGRIAGQGLAVRQGGIAVTDIAVASDLKFQTNYLGLTGLRVDALDGRFDGMLEIHDLKRFGINGKLTGLSVARLSTVAGLKDAFSGAVSGPIEVRGSLGSSARDLRAAGKLDVAAGTGGVPIKGFVEAAYDRRNESLQLGKSYLQLPSSRVDFSGTLGQLLTVRLESTNLNDLTPVIASASRTEPQKMPLELKPGGSALFIGTVSGPVRTARVAGDLTLANFQVRDQQVDRLVAKLDATSAGAQVQSFALGQNQLRVEGSAGIGLENWKFVDASAIKAELKLEGAQLARLLAEQGRKEPIDGLLSATLSVEGTQADPKVVAGVLIDKPSIYGEKFDRIRARVRYAGAGVEVIEGVAEIGPARVLLAGAFEHTPADWKNGRLNFKVSTKGFVLESIENVQKLRPGVHGRVELEAAGVVLVRNGEMFPQTLDGALGLRQLAVQGREVGDFSIDAKTTGAQLTFGIAGNLRGSKIKGGGTFQLAGDYRGDGRLEFSPLTFSSLQDLLTVAQGRAPLPVEGVVEGGITFAGPAKNPELMTARLELPVLQIVPGRQTFNTTQTRQMSLRNAEPVIVEYNGKILQVKSAHFVGRDTDMKVAGSMSVKDKTNYDLRIDGTLNVGVLQDFNPDLVSSGMANINASVRGSMADPNIIGRMELKDASFYMTDIPNGLDNASGTIVFDKRRATIEKLTAKTGGGDLAMSGFVQFGTEMTYSLQTRADSVRIRYPEGVSTTANATLNLSGSTTRSLLTGVVTIRRAGFNPRTDLGSLLAQAKPTATPVTPNEFFRGMQFDVRIETVPNLQFQTSLTQDLQAEADLRLRGTAAKPVLLGRVVVNQGEIQFFGNKYTINRGEIGFFNPVRVEPVLDMDLETRVRGVLVNINFSGTLTKLNVSYRSDPPLQSTEIIALLAVGRTPGSNSSLAASQTVTNQSVLTSGTNSLLGQAVAAPVSSRLQRFFGVSRLKIDPQLTGLNATPQARLTIEQQISRDITLTYITNLAQANQQIIRLEWDINRSWSVVALREENGVFGIDFFFKKRF